MRRVSWTADRTFPFNLMTWRFLLLRSDVPWSWLGWECWWSWGPGLWFLAPRLIPIACPSSQPQMTTGVFFQVYGMGWAVLQDMFGILDSRWTWWWYDLMIWRNGMTWWYDLRGLLGVTYHQWLLQCGLSDWIYFCFDDLCFALIWPSRLTGHSLSTVKQQ